MNSKTIKIAVVSGILAIAAYWYWSPYLAVRQMQSAAQDSDADAFNERVDYPKLRESFKGQFSAMMVDKLGETESSENGFAAFGAMLGMAMVDRMVDALVRPETMMRAMQNGQLSTNGKPPSGGATASPGDSQDTPTSAGAPEKDTPKWAYERKGMNKLIAYAIDPGAPEEVNSDRFGVVFQRNGFADWKLTEVRLPALNK